MPTPNPSAQWQEPSSSAVALQLMAFVKEGGRWKAVPQTATLEPDGYALYAGDQFDIQEAYRAVRESDGRINLLGPGMSLTGTRLYPVRIGGVWYFSDTQPATTQGYVLSDRIVLPSEVATAAEVDGGQIIIY